MNLYDSILVGLRALTKRYYELARQEKAFPSQNYGWECRAEGVSDAIRLLSWKVPQDCPNCGKWIAEATKSAQERNEMRDRLTLAQSRLDIVEPALARAYERDGKMAAAESFIEVLKTSRAAAVEQEQRTRAECNRLRAGFLSPEQAEKLADGVDDEWLDAIGGHYLKMFGQPWETRDGETASEGRQANVTALFQIIEDQKTEIERCYKLLYC